MKLKKEETNNIYLLDTNVENIFISEYMPAAPGDYIKVYLLALMYANLGKSCSIAEMTKALMLNQQTIQDAFTYWQHMGLINKKGSQEDYTIEFLSPKENLYGKRSEGSGETEEYTQNATQLQEKDIESLYSTVSRIVNRPLGGKEPTEIISWIQDLGASPEMIIYAYGYSVNTQHNDNLRYVGSIVKRWAELGLDNTEKIEEFLEENDRKRYLRRRIFKALGFNRNATEKEIEMMDRWLEEDGFTIDVILKACEKTTGITNPNLNYIEKVLRSKKEKEQEQKAEQERELTFGEVQKYYEYLREKAEKELLDREKKIYRAVPMIKKLDDELNSCGIEISKVMLSGDREKLAEIKERQENLMMERALTLTENGYPADYLDEKYLCESCQDTGLIETGERCHCYLQRHLEAKEWRNSLMK